jgi:beta-galactosidase
MRVTSDAEGLLLDGEHLPLWSGELHYWRLDPADWGAALDGVLDLGFRIVSTYVPWSVHEQPDGSYDFATGALDLPRYVDLVAERGMHLVVRPGPNCGAELETSGWPRRVLDDPECQARRPDGRGYLLPTSVHQAFMPSYASHRTLDAVAGWYDAVCAVLVPRQWPDGPIVACHVDNEMAYHFQPHAFALDYHPDAVAQFREHLQSRYGGLSALDEAWGTVHQAWSDVAPPRDGRDLPELRRLDWVRFREHHLRHSIGTLAGLLRARGMDRVPLVHNDYPRLATPLDQGALEQAGAVDVAASDVYATRAGGRYVRDVARQLAGSTRLPHLAEMGVGWITLPWLLPMSVDALDTEHTVWRALAGGARAANVFMLVGRDRWFGSPLTRRGKPREPLAEVFRRTTSLLHELDWPRLRRDVRVLLLDNRDEGRRTAARAVRGDLVPPFSHVLPMDRRVFDGHGPGDLRLQGWERDVRAAFDAAGIDWDSATTDALPDLDGYQLVVLPCSSVLDRGLPPRLRGRDVVIGPCFPTHDVALRRLGQSAGLWLVEDPSAVAALAPRPAFRTGEPLLDLTRLVGPGREVLVALNAGGQPLECPVEFDGAVTLVGRWREERLKGDGRVTIALPPWGVQVWEVHR